MKEWRAYCRSKGKIPHLMHLEVPTARTFSTFHACQKAGINGEDPDVGPMPGREYSAWMDVEEDEIVWPSNDSLLDEYVIEPNLGRLLVLSVQGFTKSLGWCVPANTVAHLTSLSGGAPSSFLVILVPRGHPSQYQIAELKFTHADIGVVIPCGSLLTLGEVKVVSVGMTASVPKASEKGVSFVDDLAVVRLAVGLRMGRRGIIVCNFVFFAHLPEFVIVKLGSIVCYDGTRDPKPV
ncbi:hypothetical protein Q3G72_006686 [Acer saccharum]|nr:hypothetical protein Q3G72_006686 [Acer saccharum]